MRIKKYLLGEAPIGYGKGGDTLRIDFPGFFRIDGFRDFPPYFRFHPYPEWNDSLPADSPHPAQRLKGPFYFSDSSGARLMEGADLAHGGIPAGRAQPGTQGLLHPPAARGL